MNWSFHRTPQEEHGKTFKISLLMLGLQRPSDGLPLLTSWQNSLHDILTKGFESWREGLEVRVEPALGFGKCIPTKGIGRASIIWFAVLWTFTELKDSMDEEEKLDFCR